MPNHLPNPDFIPNILIKIYYISDFVENTYWAKWSLGQSHSLIVNITVPKSGVPVAWES